MARRISLKRSFASRASSASRQRRCRDERHRAAVLTDRQKRARKVRRLLAARGLVEAVTWSFLPKAQAEAFGAGATLVELANPISVDLAVMRPSLLPGLLTAVERNRNRGFADVALFELGQAYRGDAARRSVSLRPPACAPVRQVCRAAAAIGTARQRTSPYSMPRPTRWRVIAALGIDASQGADHARCAGVVPSRPLRHAAARPQDGARAFRRNPSAHARGARRGGACRGLPGVPRCAAA